MVPSPKSQTRLVIVPVEVHPKLTNSGAVPEVGVALKLATGAATVGAVTEMVLVAVALPPTLVTVSLTV